MTTTKQHLPHVLMLALPLLVFGAVFAAQWEAGRERTRLPRLVLAMAATVAGSTAVHVVVIREHFAESSVVGLFFVLLSLAQLGYVVVLLLRPVRAVLVAGVLGHLGVVCVWAWTRAVSVPFGLGGREPIGVLDLLATSLEVGTVLTGLAVLYSATGGSLPSAAWAKWVRGTTMNSALPRKTSSPAGFRPSETT